MTKLIFAGIMVVLGVGLGRLLGRMATRRPEVARSLDLASRATFGAGVAVAVIVVVTSIFVVIPAGHVGVKVLFGNVDPQPLREGLNVVWNPLYDVVRMDTRVVKFQERYDAASKDQQIVHVVMALNFRLLPDRAPEVYRAIGPNYVNVIVAAAAPEVLKANTAKHNVAEILQQRQLIKLDVQKGLTEWLARYGLALNEVSLADIRFDKKYEEAVENAQIAERNSVAADWNARARIATLRGEGEAELEKAKGEAAAKRLRADAEEYYNTKVAASLRPLVIQQQYLARWDGKLPQFLTGGGAQGPLLMLPGNLLQDRADKK
ncbi:MAG TPA: prohibitin family protein [candidate division Zixibacteria bacterium]|nr:prohibitin family protein [candidate division Zixibacteria bacterium]